MLYVYVCFGSLYEDFGMRNVDRFENANLEEMNIDFFFFGKQQRAFIEQNEHLNSTKTQQLGWQTQTEKNKQTEDNYGCKHGKNSSLICSLFEYIYIYTLLNGPMIHLEQLHIHFCSHPLCWYKLWWGF